VNTPRALIALLLMSSSTAALACPPGYVFREGIGIAGCQPTGEPTGGGGTYSPPDPGPQWATRWGAIAIGGGGGFGASNSLSSKRQAEKAALKQCKLSAKRGSSACEVFSYYNQCVVIAWGDRAYTVQGAADIPRATTLAMDYCSHKTINCEIIYSNCNYPVRIR
jgi:hypothetical protein